MAGPLRTGEAVNSTSSGTSLVVTFDATASAGEIIFAAVAWKSAGAATTPTGYTLIAQSNNSNLNLALFAKVAVGTETNVTLAVSGSATLMIAEYCIYANTAIPDVYQGQAATNSNTATQTNTGTFVGVPTDSRMIVVTAAYKADTTARTSSESGPTWDEVDVGNLDVNVQSGSQSLSMNWFQDGSLTGDFSGPQIDWSASATILAACSCFISKTSPARSNLLIAAL